MARRTATFSLLPSIKRDWLKALRSGKFKQDAHQVLYDTGSGGYCCLGVLGRVMGRTDDELSGEAFPQNVGIGCDITPTDAEIWSDASDMDREAHAWCVLYNGKLTPLSELNDEKRLSFKQIADIIERRVPTHK